MTSETKVPPDRGKCANTNLSVTIIASFLDLQLKKLRRLFRFHDRLDGPDPKVVGGRYLVLEIFASAAFLGMRGRVMLGDSEIGFSPSPISGS
jgi:hypothetical protein